MFFKDWDKIAGKKPSKDSWEYLVFPRHEIAEIGISLVEWDYKLKKIKRNMEVRIPLRALYLRSLPFRSQESLSSKNW